LKEVETMNENERDDRELGTREIAALLEVTQARVRQLLLARELQGRKLGRDWYVKMSEVKRYRQVRGK